jgi:hypothetical protein
MTPDVPSLRRATAIVLAFAGSLTATALAQSVTGGLEGTVISNARSPLAGVEVTIRSPALQGERRAVSDQRGRFRFPSIPTGLYGVELRALGHAPARIDSIPVRLGTTTTLDPVLLQGQAVQLAEAVIVGSRPVIDFTTASASMTLDSATFLAVPTSRDYRSLLALVPQGNPSPYGDGTSFGGATGYDNAYFIDGIHANTPVYSNGSIRVPYNFVREVQVITDGYESEYGRSQGAVVNVVTNEGSNEFRGQAVAFFAGNGLRAAPRWGIAERPVDRYTHYDVGLSVGGPIQRDRLWFFAAYNPLIEEKDVAFTGIPVQQDRLVRHSAAGKLTWRPGPRSDVALTVLGDPMRRDAVEGTEAYSAPLTAVTDSRAVLGDYREGGWASSLRLRHQGSDRLLWNVALSRLTNVRQIAQRSGANDYASLARVDNYGSGETYGNFGRSYRLNTARTSAEASVTLLAARHTARAGVVWQHQSIHVPFFLNSFVVASPDGTWRTDQQTLGQNGRGTSVVPTVYLQDSWEIVPRLRLNAGVRWEGQFISGGSTGRVMSIDDELAPRLGLIWQPGRLGTQKIALSAGRYYEQLPLWSVVLLTMPLSSMFGTYPQNPLVDRSGGSEFTQDLRPAPVEHVDPELRGQHYDELTIGYERRLGAAHRIGVRVVVRALRAGIETAFVIADPAGPDSTTLGNPGMGALSYLPYAQRRYRALELTLERHAAGRLRYLVSYVLGRAYGNLPGEFNSDDKTPATHVTASTAFPNWWEHATGYLPSDRRHLAKFSGSYRLTDGITIGSTAYFASGLPLNEFAHDPWPFSQTAMRKRGTNGRTPSTWNADVRLSWSLPRAGSTRPQFVVDVFNLGNQRRALDVDQLHYVEPSRTIANPNYLKVNYYQAPLSVRLGTVIGF